jgi:hypothetical protein
MTLLVGIVCEGGAVIAADRQASHGVYGNVTVGHQVSKINIIGGNTLFASSGPVGLSQQFANVIQGELAQFRNRNYAGMATLLEKKIREILDPALQTAGHAARVIGQAAQSDVLCSSLLATEKMDCSSLRSVRRVDLSALHRNFLTFAKVAVNKMLTLFSRLFGQSISARRVDRTSAKQC